MLSWVGPSLTSWAPPCSILWNNKLRTIYGELRPCTEKRFSLSCSIFFMLNMILWITHTRGEVHSLCLSLRTLNLESASCSSAFSLSATLGTFVPIDFHSVSEQPTGDFYTLSEAWRGVNWADLMAAQGAFGIRFLWQVYTPSKALCLLSFW